MNNFATIGSAYRRRAMHNLSMERTQTQKMGQLVPIDCYEVLPGDRIKSWTDMVVRISPLLAPIMSQIDATIHCWFVPNRLIWEDWEEFITGGKDNDPTTAPVAPTITITDYSPGTLADYLNVNGKDTLPNDASHPSRMHPLTVSALPFRVYDFVYNNCYRDENLQDEVGFSTASGPDTTTNVNLLNRCWNADRFTKAQPWPQRGPSVQIPISGSAGVTGNIAIEANGVLAGTSNGNTANIQTNGASGANIRFDRSSTFGSYQDLSYASGLKATHDLEADLSGASATDIRTLRIAEQLQAWAELSASAGYRYVENTLAHFGIRIPDARLQRPEFLGGGKSPVVVSEVLQTSSTDSTSPQGNMAGHAFSAQRSNGFNKTFVEHGFVLVLLNVQPKTQYQQGIPKMFFRDTKESYFWPMFENIGEEAIYNRELFAQGDNVLDDGGNVIDKKVFGYGPRYQDYRVRTNEVHGQFKTTLAYWHTGRIFENLPQLSSAFVTADNVTRINADPSTDNVYVSMNNNVHALRPVGRVSTPGLFIMKR